MHLYSAGVRVTRHGNPESSPEKVLFRGHCRYIGHELALPHREAVPIFANPPDRIFTFCRYIECKVLNLKSPPFISLYWLPSP